MSSRLARALALGIAVATLSASAAPALAGEIFLGGFAHDVKGGVSASPHEDGTTDVEIGYRTHPFDSLWFLLKPMFYAKGELNTSNRTHFYTLGIEWRRHLFNTRFYGDFGVGAAYVDGYNTYPDHFVSGQQPPANATSAQLARYNYDLGQYKTFKAMGSDYVFNPNFTLGYDLTSKIGVELAWEHYSNAGFGKRNPGMDNYGARVVYRFGGPF